MTFPIRMNRLLPLFTLAACTLGHAQVDFKGSYKEDFDKLNRTRGLLAGSWKSGFQIPLEILPGWQIARISPDMRGDLVLRELPADLIVGRISSFSNPNEEDRAFGQVSTEDSTAAFGISLKNTTGKTIQRVKISYAAEVWRSPSGTPGKLNFTYATSASGISETNYLSSKSMKKSEQLDGKVPAKVTAGDVLNGNAPENRTVVSSVIEGLDWKPGETLFLAWAPSETQGNGIGIDDLVISAEETRASSTAGFTGRYEENFDVLTPAARASLPGTSQLNQQQKIPLLVGWQAARTGGTKTTNLGVVTSDGSEGGGSLYSFGRAGEEDRALGAVTTQSMSLNFGTSLTNTSDRTFHRVTVKYAAEIWRTPSQAVDKIPFNYGSTAAGITEEDYLTNTAMMRFEGLDPQVPTPESSSAAVDGNAPGNRQEITGTIEGLTWKPGETMFFSWVMENDKGRGMGSGIGIDDLVITAE